MMAAFRIFRPQIAGLRSFGLRSFGLAATLLLGGVGCAAAQDRCEGTLCDFYYDHMAKPPQDQPAQGQPVRAQAPRAAQGQAQPAQASDSLLGRLFSGGQAPAQPADGGVPPAKKPFVAVQGGGVVGLMQGRAPTRCTGTLCDLYYGGAPKEEPEAAPAAAAPGAPTVRAEEAEIESPVAPARGVEPRESVRGCAANPRDPWSCYR